MISIAQHDRAEMGSVIRNLETQLLTTALRSPCDNSRSIAEQLASNSIFCQPFNSVEGSPPRIQQPPTHMPEIHTPLTPLGPANRKSSATSTAKKLPIFLTVPLEIRLHIYSYLLISNPVHHAHLSPLAFTSTLPPYSKEEHHHTVFHGTGLSYPLPQPSTCISFDSCSENYKLFAPSKSIDDIKSMRTTIYSNHSNVQGKIPTGLLASCKQVHNEARLIPFHTNRFTFVNWFWSGVYASRQFTRGLKLWQSEAIRWPSVEVLGRDLWIGAPSAGPPTVVEATSKGDWWDLCAMWKGVWDLRLGIKGSAALRSNCWSGIPNTSGISEEATVDTTLLNPDLEWIQNGLLRLYQLRQIEIEIDDKLVERDAKLRFCQELQKVLNKKRSREDGWMGTVKVVFVERIRVDVPDSELKWYGGAPPGMDSGSSGFF